MLNSTSFRQPFKVQNSDQNYPIKTPSKPDEKGHFLAC